MKKLYKHPLAHRMLAVLMAALFTLSLAAFAAAESLPGGWQEKLTAKQLTLPSKVKKSFQKLMSAENLTAKPLALLGEQSVNGKNYCILAYTKAKNEEATNKGLSLIYMNLDSKGSGKLLKNQPLTSTQEGLSGGYQYATSSKKMKLTSSLKKIFKKAAANLTGLSLKPLGLLGTQVVSGMNYLYLARGTTITQTPTKALYLVIVYCPLSGSPEITDIQAVDVGGNA